MAAAVGQLLEILAVPNLGKLYESTIRKMQPAELVRRLDNENVSTRGHMPELRGRLLRLEAMKLHPKMEVPWYAEDFGCASGRPAVQTRDYDMLDEFIRARYRETQLRQVQAQVWTKGLEQTRTDEQPSGGRSGALVADLNKAMKECSTGGERRMDKPSTDSATVETTDEIVDESEYTFDENLDAETRSRMSESSETDRSSNSICRLESDLESFEMCDKAASGTWGRWSSSSTMNICTEVTRDILD